MNYSQQQKLRDAVNGMCYSHIDNSQILTFVIQCRLQLDTTAKNAILLAYIVTSTHRDCNNKKEIQSADLLIKQLQITG